VNSSPNKSRNTVTLSSIYNTFYPANSPGRFWPSLLAVYFTSHLFFAVNVVAQQADNFPEGLVNFADFIFTNGKILTADADKDFTVAQAVAVRGNRILAVGSDEKIIRYAGPNTRRIDIQGRSMTPGIIYTNGDNAVPGGDLVKTSQWGGRLYPAVGGENLDKILATFAHIIEQEGAPGEPLFIRLLDQWAAKAMEAWSISTLDEIAPDVPVIVYLDPSFAFSNTAMIELAIAEGFPVDHFQLDRDVDVKFTGRTGEQFNGFVGRELRPFPSPEWFDEVAIPDLRKIVTDWARHGVTGVNGHMSGVTMLTLNRLFHEGDGRKLAIRAYAALDFLRQNPEGEKYLKRLGNVVDFALTDDRGPMVTMVGASLGPFTGSPDASASLLTINPKTTIIPEISPNSHGYNRWTGQWFTGLRWEDLTPEQKAQSEYNNLMLARQHGWPINSLHNMGSKGIKLVMQFFKDANEQDNLYVKELWRPNGTIHNIDWMPENYAYWESHPEIHDLLSFSIDMRSGIEQRDSEPLGIKNVIEKQHGLDSLNRMAPLRSLHEKGIPFHIEGSYPGRRGVDWPTWNMYKAVARIDGDGRLIGPKEAIDRETAFLAMTRWPARYIGSLDDLGSIEPGKLADLVVFDGSIMDVPIENLPDLLPVMTMVGGWIAYEDPDSGL
jgi:predicted amidohydrolase YtcJ